MVIVTSPATPADSMHELVTLARAKPGELSYATSGNGGSTHLAGAMLENATGTKMINVPFKGNGPALAEGMAGRGDLLFLPHLRHPPPGFGGETKGAPGRAPPP